MVYFLIIYLLIFPLYLWGSGLPQISDVLILIGGLFHFVRNPCVIKTKGNYYLLWFVFYSTIINLIYFGVYYERSFLIAGFRYIFLFFTFLFFTEIMVGMKKDAVNIEKLTYTLLITSLFQIIYIVLSENQGSRNVGTFNNPNQLGYFSLLTNAINLTLYQYQKPKNRKGLLVFLLTLITSFFLSLLSLSNAAIISNFVLLIYGLVLFLKKSNFFRKIIVLFFGMTLFILFLNRLEQSSFILSLNNRMSNTMNKVLSAGNVRGYSRILFYPNKLILGAGEGFYLRFKSAKELHSTFGNILFSYGLIGFFLFIKFRISVLPRNSIGNIVDFSVFLYGLSHNGIRSTLLWFYLALKFILLNDLSENTA